MTESERIHKRNLSYMKGDFWFSVMNSCKSPGDSNWVKCVPVPDNLGSPDVEGSALELWEQRLEESGFVATHLSWKL